MLYQLSIKNVAIIESVELSFDQGLNILSGETGAGKSILIDSLNMVLGARVSRELIRSGARSARVEAVFDGVGPRARALLEQWELAGDEDQVILSREITDTGRSSARINGSMATLAQVKELASLLVDVHGQHEYRYLLDAAQHTRILDSFAGEPAQQLLAQLAALASDHRRITAELTERFGDEGERERRMDILQFQIREITEAKLNPGEEEQLESERSRMANAEKLRSAVAGAYSLLCEGGGRDEGSSSGAQTLVERSAGLLERMGTVDGELAALSSRLTAIGYDLEDVIATLRDMSDRFDFDDYRMDEVENRLAQIRQLKRKYGGSIDEILAFCDTAQQEYDRYLHAEENMAQLQTQQTALVQRWQKTAARLTQLRQKTAARFAQAVMAQLADLGMGDARFEARLSPRGLGGSLHPQGAEAVQFYLAANRGEAPGPLDRVASGGELSRMMLALKAVVASMDDIPTMIFDEIDSGISGTMARIVGQKLALIARARQVISITHTAQIAAMADSHFYIEKTVIGQRTQTRVTALEPDKRYLEIARLVGGEMAGGLSHEHAREMIRWCDKFKASLEGQDE